MQMNDGQSGSLNRPKIFVSYASEDRRFLNRLRLELKVLERQGLIQAWYDGKIIAGNRWHDKIVNNLEKAEIIIFLVSPDLLASDYIDRIELQTALKRDERGEAIVIPVIIRPTDGWKYKLGDLQALPEGAKAVTSWPNRDKAWKSVVRGLKRVLAAREFG